MRGLHLILLSVYFPDGMYQETSAKMYTPF